MVTEELLIYVLGESTHELAKPMAVWLKSSRRFAVFVETFRDKIRKKLHDTQGAQNLFDVRLELETAYRLLQERPLSVVYEPQQARQGRGPDFAVTYTSSLTFMLEVTRLRAEPKGAPTETEMQVGAAAGNGIERASRLAEVVCGKLGQLRPQHANVVLAGVEGLALTNEEMRAALLRVQQRAERNDLAFLARHHFRDRADFFQRYQCLSEVVVRGLSKPLVEWVERVSDRLEPAPAPASTMGEPVLVWVNPQAKHPLPSKVRTALYRSQTG